MLSVEGTTAYCAHIRKSFGLWNIIQSLVCVFIVGENTVRMSMLTSFLRNTEATSLVLPASQFPVESRTSALIQTASGHIPSGEKYILVKFLAEPASHISFSVLCFEARERQRVEQK